MSAGLLRTASAACRLVIVGALVGLALVGQPAVAAEEPDIVARYAVVVDADTGEILYDKDMNAPVAPASLTKIFTAVVALESAPLDQTVTVDSFDLVGEASMGLIPGDELTLRTLLYGMMLPSGNDAAMSIARNLGQLPGDTPQQSVNRFMERINAMATRLGLEQTQLFNPHGLDQAGHQSSARDLAAITMYALRNATFREIIGAPYYQGDGYELYQANQLLNTHPGVIGGKTGITERAGYCLVEVAQRDGRTIIAVLLQSTRDAWYADAAKLLEHGFAVAASPPVGERPTIRLAPAAPDVPAVSGAAAADLRVDRLGETTAVVRQGSVPDATASLSLNWLMASLIAMGAVLVLALTYPALLGLACLIWSQGRSWSFGMPVAMAAAGDVRAVAPPGAPRPARRSVRRREERRQPRPGAVSTATLAARGALDSPAAERPRRPPAPVIVPLNAAETLTARAIRLAGKGDYHTAMHEFARALRVDPSYDLSRVDGFWSMPTGGFVAAARAYEQLDRSDDARTLLTVIRLRPNLI